VVLLVFLAPSPAHADGCKFHVRGTLVPEHEQRAFIEWADDTETLYVAARSDPTSEANVWVVPVRAAADRVRAEPVEEFPTVVLYTPIKKLAEESLRQDIAFVGAMDSGGLCCPVLGLGGCGMKGSPSVTEASRVEKYGMIVTVVSAHDRGGLERYLDSQGMNRAAADLSSLDPYFGQADYAFVCGWVPGQGKPITATGLKIDFPSPTLWFPLRPTRAYTKPVHTVVYVRGNVKPAPGCDMSELRCQYVSGIVERRGVGQAFESTHHASVFSYYGSGERVGLTRVTLTSDPQKWDRDLELIPGTTFTGTIAFAQLGEKYVPLKWLASGILGALLGLAIPRLTIPRAERRRSDWLYAAMTGGLIVLTIWASALMFAAWREERYPRGRRQPKRWLVLPLLAVTHFLIVLGVCHALIAWLNATQ
jgi:hypothetical protein